MRLWLIDIEAVTTPEEKLMSLFIRQSQVDEVIYKATQLIEN